MIASSPNWESLNSSQPTSRDIPFRNEIKWTSLQIGHTLQVSFHLFFWQKHRGEQGQGHGKPSDGFLQRWVTIKRVRSQPRIAWARLSSSFKAQKQEPDLQGDLQLVYKFLEAVASVSSQSANTAERQWYTIVRSRNCSSQPLDSCVILASHLHLNWGFLICQIGGNNSTL
jgi:hypothetical protein